MLIGIQSCKSSSALQHPGGRKFLCFCVEVTITFLMTCVRMKSTADGWQGWKVIMYSSILDSAVPET